MDNRRGRIGDQLETVQSNVRMDPWLNSRIQQDIPKSWLYQSRPLITQQIRSPLIDLPIRAPNVHDRGMVSRILSAAQPGCFTGAQNAHHFDVRRNHKPSGRNGNPGHSNDWRRPPVEAAKSSRQRDMFREQPPLNVASQLSSLDQSSRCSPARNRAEDRRLLPSSSSRNTSPSTAAGQQKQWKAPAHAVREPRPSRNDELDVLSYQHWQAEGQPLRTSWSSPTLDAVYAAQANIAANLNFDITSAHGLRSLSGSRSNIKFGPDAFGEDPTDYPNGIVRGSSKYKPRAHQTDADFAQQNDGTWGPTSDYLAYSQDPEVIHRSNRAKTKSPTTPMDNGSTVVRMQKGSAHRVYIPKRAPAFSQPQKDTNGPAAHYYDSATPTATNDIRSRSLPSSKSSHEPLADQRPATRETFFHDADLARESILSLSGSDDEPSGITSASLATSRRRSTERISESEEETRLATRSDTRFNRSRTKHQIPYSLPAGEVPARSSSKNAYAARTTDRFQSPQVLGHSGSHQPAHAEHPIPGQTDAEEIQKSKTQKQAALARLKRDLGSRPSVPNSNVDQPPLPNGHQSGQADRKNSALARLKKDIATKPTPLPTPVPDSIDDALGDEQTEFLMEVTPQEAALLRAMRRTKLAVHQRQTSGNECMDRNHVDCDGDVAARPVRRGSRKSREQHRTAPVAGFLIGSNPTPPMQAASSSLFGATHQFSHSPPLSEDPSSPRIPPTLASVSTATTVLPYGASSSKHPAHRRAHLADQGKREASERKASQVLGLDGGHVMPSKKAEMRDGDVISMYLLDENDSGTLGSYEGSTEMLFVR